MTETGWVSDLLGQTGQYADPPLSSLMSLSLTVHGEPAPQGSKTWRPNGSLGEASLKVRPWREAIVGEVLRQNMAHGITAPVIVRATFVFIRPKSHYTARGLRPNAPHYVGRTPDLDKLCRSTLDGLVQSGLLLDDKQVVVLHAQKRYDTWQGAMLSIEETHP